MAKVKACYINILETSTVTLTLGTEDVAFPLYRLYDRECSDLFKITAAATFQIKVNQGAIKAIDRLLIPAGHNLSGLTLTFSYSDYDADDYSQVEQWTQSGNALIDIPLDSSMTHKYWKLTVASPSAIPQIPELFLTSTYEFERNPSRPCDKDKRFNVERLQEAGGQPRYIKHGEPRAYRLYALPRMTAAQSTNIQVLNDAWDGCKPFFLCDHNGVWLFGELLSPIGLAEESSDKDSCTLEFQEIPA
ncbi:MAG: hypothetical protein Q7U10_08825 [Thermodesulfovibrionia bacterium]|nr:hypothetical protein [Thermodesulfovibrionia bacterium]